MTIIAGAGILEAGGLLDRGTVLTFIFVISLVLIFLFGYALRDVFQKRGQRLRAAKKPDGAIRRE